MTRDREQREPRFDVYFEQSDYRRPSIDYHHCREWEQNPNTGEFEGCYGTNPNHGFTFDEAVMAVVNYLREEEARWLRMTLEEWERRIEDSQMSWDEYLECLEEG